MDWLRQLPIGQYVDPGDGAPRSWLRDLDPRLKLLWTLVFLLSPILAGSLWRLGLVAVLLLITLLSGLPWRLWLRGVLLWLALALLVGLLSCLLTTGGAAPATLQRPPTELRLLPAVPGAPAAERSGMAWELVRWGPLRLGPVELGPLVVNRRSAELGMHSATLLFTLIHSANLLLLTTAPEELVWAIDWWLMPLGRLGLPAERLGFTLLLALRFLPLVQEELQNLLRALATRAVSFRALGWKGGLSLVLALGERLLANVLLRSEQGAEALLARGGHWLPPEDLREASTGLGAAGWIGLLLLPLVLFLRVRW
ncbi:MAG: CbiQ family ECF transporter T component, partial [Cyanobium sp.]